jgi:anti-sigma regulatory factor (Ser/Thr protein kinase)
MQLRPSAKEFSASHTHRYPAVAASCGLARADAAKALTCAGADDDAIEVGVLVISELTTNALIHHDVRHGELIELRVRLKPGPGGVWAELSVLDGGQGAIGVGLAADSAEHEDGRGLFLIRGLGVRVAGHRVRTGYLVRAAFPLDGAVRERVCRCDCAAFGHADRWVCRSVAQSAATSVAVAGQCAESVLMPVCSPCGILRERARQPLSGGCENSVAAAAGVLPQGPRDSAR